MPPGLTGWARIGRNAGWEPTILTCDGDVTEGGHKKVGTLGDSVWRQAPEASGVDARQAQGLQIGEHNDQANYFGGRHEHHHYPSPTIDVSWPVLVGRAPLLADAFQFRPGLRTQVDVALIDSGPVVITQVVIGDGGTGKTQLAASVFRQVLSGLDVPARARRPQAPQIDGVDDVVQDHHPRPVGRLQPGQEPGRIPLPVTRA